MKSGLWYVLIVVALFIGFLIGYSVSSYTGYQKVAGFVEEVGAGGYGGEEAGGYGGGAGGYGGGAGGYGGGAGGYGGGSGGYGGSAAGY